MTERTTASVIGAPIDVISWEAAVEKILRWSLARVGRVVCICNVHSVVSSRHDSKFRDAIERADMATPDGAPVAWMLRRQGYSSQGRIDGPDLMLRCCEAAESTGCSIYLYGSSPATLRELRDRLHSKFPRLRIAGSYSPPFRSLTRAEDAAVVKDINDSGAGIVWVGLGCPKQELWMAAHRHSIKAVMVGVGAAFEYHAGALVRAPVWMQRRGLEWLYRLVCEPRRLWRRYLETNSLFLWYASAQLVSRLGRR